MSPANAKKFKSLLRKKLRQKLLLMNDRLRKKKSRKITNKVFQSEHFKRTRSLMIYSSLPMEVQTKAIIQRALNLKKKVFLPAVEARRRQLAIYRIHRYPGDLIKGAFGILEPRRVLKNRGCIRDLDLIFIPGLGFDKKGTRLGRGGGYYDRFLKKTGRIKKVGLAFKNQIVAKIPAEKHDVKVHCIYTD